MFVKETFNLDAENVFMEFEKRLFAKFSEKFGNFKLVS